MNYELLGGNIRKYRKMRKLTQEQLSETSNISSVFMSQIENASRKPSLETVVNIAYALNVSIDLLINGGTKNPELADFIDVELTREQLNILSFAFKDRSKEDISALIKAFVYLLDYEK